MTDHLHTARDRHLRVCPEDAWGQCPAAPEWTALPLSGPGYVAGPRREFFAPGTRYAGFRRAPLLPDGSQLEGSLTTEPRPQTVSVLLDMALARHGGRPGSYCADFYTPPAPRRHLGLLARRLEFLATPAATRLRLRLVGRQEVPRPALAPADFDYSGLSPVPFVFRAATVALDGTPLNDVAAINLTVDNAISAGPPHAAGLASFFEAGTRKVAVDIPRAGDDGVLKEALRAGATLSLSVELSHPEGHGLSIQLPALTAARAEDRPDPAGTAGTWTRLEATTDAAGDDVTYSLTLNS
jgi:hypothetical protein